MAVTQFPISALASNTRFFWRPYRPGMDQLILKPYFPKNQDKSHIGLNGVSSSSNTEDLQKTRTAFKRTLTNPQTDKNQDQGQPTKRSKVMDITNLIHDLPSASNLQQAQLLPKNGQCLSDDVNKVMSISNLINRREFNPRSTSFPWKN